MRSSQPDGLLNACMYYLLYTKCPQTLLLCSAEGGCCMLLSFVCLTASLLRSSHGRLHATRLQPTSHLHAIALTAPRTTDVTVTCQYLCTFLYTSIVTRHLLMSSTWPIDLWNDASGKGGTISELYTDTKLSLYTVNSRNFTSSVAVIIVIKFTLSNFASGKIIERLT